VKLNSIIIIIVLLDSMLKVSRMHDSPETVTIIMRREHDSFVLPLDVGDSATAIRDWPLIRMLSVIALLEDWVGNERFSSSWQQGCVFEAPLLT
jgi:hypothetical protein